MDTKKICRTAIIGALYTALTIAVSPISYGAVQFRLSEALVVLPIFFPESVIGLTVGCVIANVFGNGLLDIIFGSLGTLLSGVLYILCCKKMAFTKKVVFCELFAIVLNAILVPISFVTFSNFSKSYFLGALTVGLGELVVISTLGTLLAVSLKKMLKTN